MRLQNLFFATMVACAFSACSNDDDPNIPNPGQELDATLTVAFNAVGNNGSTLKSFSKADADADNQFDKVNTIGIAVFNKGAMGSVIADEGLISYQERTIGAGADADTTACIAAKSGRVRILVVANPTKDLFSKATNYDEFLAAASTEAIDPQSLLMSSAYKDVELKRGRNMIGAKKVFDGKEGELIDPSNIKVYRNVARIEVPQIKVAPRDGFGNGHTAKFTLSAIYVSKVRSTAMVFGNPNDAWSSVVNSAANLIEGETINANRASYPNYVKAFSKNNVVKYGQSETGVLELNENDTRLFVYDNSSTAPIDTTSATRLVIRGTYEYTTDGGASSESVDAYWTTMINNATPQGGEGEFDAHCGVLRNVKYLVNVTITGPGSSTEEIESNAASLTTNVEVVPWGQITLDPSID